MGPLGSAAVEDKVETIVVRGEPGLAPPQVTKWSEVVRLEARISKIGRLRR